MGYCSASAVAIALISWRAAKSDTPGRILPITWRKRPPRVVMSDPVCEVGSHNSTSSDQSASGCTKDSGITPTTVKTRSAVVTRVPTIDGSPP